MKKAPSHLSAEAKKTWAEIVGQFEISDSAGLKILKVSLESYDRAQAARAQIEREGMTVLDKFGQVKSHPLLPVERDSRAAFLAGLKALCLDLEPLHTSPGRPAGS